jgi:hypothetical protein
MYILARLQELKRLPRTSRRLDSRNLAGFRDPSRRRAQKKIIRAKQRSKKNRLRNIINQILFPLA